MIVLCLSPVCVNLSASYVTATWCVAHTVDVRFIELHLLLCARASSLSLSVSFLSACPRGDTLLVSEDDEGQMASRLAVGEHFPHWFLQLSLPLEDQGEEERKEEGAGEVEEGARV